MALGPAGFQVSLGHGLGFGHGSFLISVAGHLAIPMAVAFLLLPAQGHCIFRNTIVIMTSNIGTRQLKEFGQGVGFDTSAKKEGRDKYANSVIQKALHKTFAPEFLNWIDDVIMFGSLSKEDIHQIIDIELKGLFERVLTLGYTIELSDAAKDFIADKGFDAQYGARPLKRAIQKYLEDPMAEVIILLCVLS